MWGADRQKWHKRSPFSARAFSNAAAMRVLVLVALKGHLQTLLQLFSEVLVTAAERLMTMHSVLGATLASFMPCAIA